MNVLIAPDSFKGSLTAVRAAEIMADVITRLDPAARCLLLPQADGGEGTVDAIHHAQGGRLHLHTVPDPLGRPVQARWLQLTDGSALIESASCIGLPLLREAERDPLQLRSDGVGTLLRHLHERGYTGVYCGLGGTATNDAGFGMASALGADIRLRTESPGNVREALAAVTSVRAEACADRRLTALADVVNPLCGPRGATAVYGPQKGIPEQDIQEWDRAIRHFAEVGCRDVRRVDTEVPGMGAAGGLGFALACFAGARIVSGSDFVRVHSGFEDAVAHADIVLTGEGRIDGQSAQGKVLAGICRSAAEYEIPVAAFCGAMEGKADTLAGQLGLAGIFRITPEHLSAADAMRHAESLLETAVRDAWPAISAMR